MFCPLIGSLLNLCPVFVVALSRGLRHSRRCCPRSKAFHAFVHVIAVVVFCSFCSCGVISVLFQPSCLISNYVCTFTLCDVATPTSPSRHTHNIAYHFKERVIDHCSARAARPLLIARGAQLAALVDVLESCKEFGFDLEAHNARTYHGITCLMQISTETKVLCGRGVLLDRVVSTPFFFLLLQWISQKQRPQTDRFVHIFAGREGVGLYHRYLFLSRCADVSFCGPSVMSCVVYQSSSLCWDSGALRSEAVRGCVICADCETSREQTCNIDTLEAYHRLEQPNTCGQGEPTTEVACPLALFDILL